MATQTLPAQLNSRVRKVLKKRGCRDLTVDNEVFNEVLTEEDVVYIAKTMNDWKPILPALGLQFQDGNDIDLDTSLTSPEQKRIAVLMKFCSKHGIYATYNKLLLAFFNEKRMDLVTRVADRVAERGKEIPNERRRNKSVGNHFRSRSRSPHKQCSQDTDESPLQAFIYQESTTDASTEDIILDWEERFGQLVKEMFEIVNKNKKEIEKFYNKVKHALPQRLKGLKKHINYATITNHDVEEFFDSLDNIWSFIDYELLSFMIKRCGTNELKQKMRTYEKDIEHFFEHTTIEQLIKNWKPRIVKSQTDNLTQCITKFRWNPKTTKLKEIKAIQEVIQNAFPQELAVTAFVVYNVESSSVTITWMVWSHCPLSGINYTKNFTIVTSDFAIQYNLLSFSFGGSILYSEPYMCPSSPGMSLDKIQQLGHEFAEDTDSVWDHQLGHESMPSFGLTTDHAYVKVPSVKPWRRSPPQFFLDQYSFEQYNEDESFDILEQAPSALSTSPKLQYSPRVRSSQAMPTSPAPPSQFHRRTGDAGWKLVPSAVPSAVPASSRQSTKPKPPPPPIGLIHRETEEKSLSDIFEAMSLEDVKGYGQPSQKQTIGEYKELPVAEIRKKPCASFKAENDCSALKNAMTKGETSDMAIMNKMAYRSWQQRQEILEKFKSMLGKDLMDELKRKLDGLYKITMMALFMSPREYDAHILHKALKGADINVNAIMEILFTRSHEEIEEIKAKYQSDYSSDLESEVRSSTSGGFRKLYTSILTGSRDPSTSVNSAKAKDDAQVLYEAGETRWNIDTDKSKFNQMLRVGSFAHLRMVFEEYSKLCKCDIEHSIHQEASKNLRDQVLTLVKCVRNPAAYFAEILHKSLKYPGTDNQTLIRVMVSRSEVDMIQIKAKFKENYDMDLRSCIMLCSSGMYQGILLALAREDL